MAAEMKLRLLEEEQAKQREKQLLEQQRIEEEKEFLVKREHERYTDSPSVDFPSPLALREFWLWKFLEFSEIV